MHSHLASAALSTVVALAVIAGLFAGIESLWPERPSQRRWRAGGRVDATWFVAGFVSRAVASAVLSAITAG